MPADKVKTVRAPLYLIAGGRGQDRTRGRDPLLHAVVSCLGVTTPTVAYIGAASGDNNAFFLLLSRMLRRAGTGVVTLAPLCGRRADSPKAGEVVRAADIVFISGGDVEEGMRVLTETRMLPLLRRLWRAGKHFFGVSAGSIMLARSWVRWTDPRNDASAQLFRCMGLAPVLCDAHGEGDGWTELKALLALAPVGSTGYGIVTGSGLVVGQEGSIAALGGEVHVFRRNKAGVAQRGHLLPDLPGARGR